MPKFLPNFGLLSERYPVAALHHGQTRKHTSGPVPILKTKSLVEIAVLDSGLKNNPTALAAVS
jgi:hypothetical protein